MRIPNAFVPQHTTQIQLVHLVWPYFMKKANSYDVQLKVSFENVSFYEVKLKVSLEKVHFYEVKLKVGFENVNFHW